MQMNTIEFNTIDFLIIGLYVTFAIGVGFFMRKRASGDTDSFFLAGRKLPWWVVGTSMIATSFAADTPLVVTGWVRDGGIWRNWLWWCFAVGGIEHNDTCPGVASRLDAKLIATALGV